MISQGGSQYRGYRGNGANFLYTLCTPLYHYLLGHYFPPLWVILLILAEKIQYQYWFSSYRV